MPLDRFNYEAPRQRINLTEYLDNRNTTSLGEAPKRLDYRNTLRGLKGALRGMPEMEHKYGYDPFGGPGTPGEERVPNQPPAMTTTMPVKREETLPGQQPGLDFSMAAVNAPEAGRETSVLPVKKSQAQQAQPDPYLLATILGAAGEAIGGRGTWQSRLGGNMANIASRLYGKKQREKAVQEQREYEKPDVELDRAIKRERLKKLRTPSLERTQKQKELEYFLSLTPKQKNEYNKLFGKTEGDTRTAEQKKFEYYKSLGKEERKTWDKLFGKNGGYHYVQDDQGRVSVYKDGALIKGSGKGKSKTSREGMTEQKARKELLNLAKYKQKLKETGGMDDILFAMISRDNPQIAEQLRGSDKSEIMDFITEQENYYRQYIPGSKTKKSSKPSWKDYQ